MDRTVQKRAKFYKGRDLGGASFPLCFTKSKTIPANFNDQISSLEIPRGRKCILWYQPKAYEANVLAPLNLGNSKFDSVALNYLLHCLPGSIATKGIVFQHLKPYLNKDAVVFGTTIFGRGVPHNFIGRMLMNKYNATGVFSNREDDFETLERILKEHFRDFSLHILGCVAFFKGHF